MYFRKIKRPRVVRLEFVKTPNKHYDFSKEH